MDTDIQGEGHVTREAAIGATSCSAARNAKDFQPPLEARTEEKGFSSMVSEGAWLADTSIWDF